MLRRRFANTLETISHQKVPIAYPKTKPPVPSQADYEMLGVKPEDDNRVIVDKFREAATKFHPAFTIAPSAHFRYSQLEAAYNRIALHRMSEQGVPQPVTMVHNYALPYSKMIKEFLEENSFFTPRVPAYYLTFLTVFWISFGVLYSLNDRYDPLGFKATLAELEANS